MFDIGFWEIMLIAILALVVIGPERLPKVARTAGHWFGKTRRFIEGVKGEVEQQFDTSEMKRLLHNQEVQIKELQSRLNGEISNIDKDYHSSSSENDYLEFLDEEDEKDQHKTDTKQATQNQYGIEPAATHTNQEDLDDVMISRRSQSQDKHDG